MKKNLLLIAVAVGFALSSCTSPSSPTTSTTSSTTGNDHINSENVSGQAEDGNVPYSVAQNYFVKNTYKSDKIDELKITNQEEFDKIFGMAATMGDKGKPTRIDFSKQYVIAVVGQVVNKESDFIINGLVKKNNEIILDYTLKSGKELSFTIQPSLILVVDNSYNGEVKFEKK